MRGLDPGRGLDIVPGLDMVPGLGLIRLPGLGLVRIDGLSVRPVDIVPLVEPLPAEDPVPVPDIAPVDPVVVSSGRGRAFLFFVLVLVAGGVSARTTSVAKAPVRTSTPMSIVSFFIAAHSIGWRMASAASPPVCFVMNIATDC